MNNKIVIVGFGGHAKSLVDSILSYGKYEIAGYTDIEEKGIPNIPYLGTDDELKSIFDSGVKNAALGIGFLGKSNLREKLYKKLSDIGFNLPPIIDPTAVIAKRAEIKDGCFISKHAVVNVGAYVGKMCIINTGAIVEHDSAVGDFTHVAVGTVLCGNVKVGNDCLIGANATVLQGITIGNKTIVGAGSIVLSDVEENMTVVGIVKKYTGGGGNTLRKYSSISSVVSLYENGGFHYFSRRNAA